MPVGRAVISLAVPTVIGQLITVFYNMADTFFIGQLNDPTQVAAATLAMPAFVLLGSIANLFGIGGSSLISRSLGRGDREKARRTAAFSIWAAAVLALIYGLAFIFLEPMILPVLGAKGSTWEYCNTYLFWTVTVGSVPTVMNVCLANLVRSEGMARHAAVGVALGGIMNIILDPVFIFGFGMEIKGAAIATALSNAMATLYFILIIYRRKKETVITASFSVLTFGAGIPKEVCLVGLPNACMTFLAMLSNVVLNNLMASHSDAAIAGMGIAKKIALMTFSVVLGMTQGTLSLIAYNYAAKNRVRLMKTIRTVFMYTFCLGVFTTLFLFFLAAPVSRLFIADPTTVHYSRRFVEILSIISPMQAISLVVIMIFQAMGRKVKPLVLSVMRKGSVDLMFMYFLNATVGTMGVAWATPIAELLACIIAASMFLPVYRKLAMPDEAVDGGRKRDDVSGNGRNMEGEDRDVEREDRRPGGDRFGLEGHSAHL